jgi:hypothetical protein
MKERKQEKEKERKKKGREKERKKERKIPANCRVDQLLVFNNAINNNIKQCHPMFIPMCYSIYN